MSLALEQCKQWLEEIVIGLNLCPFARKPWLDHKVRFVGFATRKKSELLLTIAQEIELLIADTDMETTLIVLETQASSFTTTYIYLNWQSSF